MSPLPKDRVRGQSADIAFAMWAFPLPGNRGRYISFGTDKGQHHDGAGSGVRQSAAVAFNRSLQSGGCEVMTLPWKRLGGRYGSSSSRAV